MPIYLDILNYIFVDDSSLLKIILMGHFSLTALGAVGSTAPNVYLFYNLPVLLLLLWNIIDKKVSEALRLVMASELCSVVIDVFYIGGQIPNSQTKYTAYFSLVVALIQLLVRPIVVFNLLKHRDTIESFSEDDDDSKNEGDDRDIEEVIVDHKNPFEPPGKR